jgi:hypothetical protein
MKEQLWEQAYNDVLATRLTTPDSVAMILKGVKIIKKDGDIKILNTKKGGDFYKEITKQQYELFFELGFRQGVYRVAIDNYMHSLSTLTFKIRDEIGQRNNQKHYLALKIMRQNLMNKINETKKLCN